MPGAAADRRPYLPVLAFCIAPLLFHLIIVETAHLRLGHGWGLGVLFKLGFVTVSALTHWAIYGSLLLAFALTLRPGREPLITGMARRMHGPLSSEMLRYTKGVTAAWTVFFAAQLGLSVALFCTAPLVVWSFFVNILDIPLVVAMFCVEYVVRLRYLRDPPRHSLSMILNMVADIRKPRETSAISL